MILYSYPSSSHCRFVVLVARILNIELEIEEVDLCDQENYGEAFSKINPLHQVPVLIDGDFKLTESRAIGCWLADLKPGNSLFPTDPKQRANILQYLFLDATYVVPTWYDKAIVPIITGVARSISSESKGNIHKMVNHLESILLQNEFFGGAEVQLSDLSIFCSVGFLYHVGLSFDKYPNVLRWYESVKAIEGAKNSDADAENFAKMFANIWSEN